MKRKKVLIAGILIVIIMLLFSIIIPEDCRDNIDDFFSWISSISTFLTLIIALLLFEKYGLKKKLANKEEDLMINLIDTLSATSFFVCFEGYTTSFNLYQIKKEQFEGMLGKENILLKKVAVTDKIFEDLNALYSFSYQYWLPPNIKSKLQNAISITATYKEKKEERNVELSNHCRICARWSERNIEDAKYGVMINRKNLEEFINPFVELSLEINAWLELNGEK